jgi:UDP-glucose 4-epimerase
MENNVIGTFNMLEAARMCNVRRFVFASSGAPIGECEPPIHEEMAPHPVSPYGASKLAGEAYCSAYYRTFGLQTVTLRFGNVYGPGSGHKSSVVAKFIKQAKEGNPLEIYGDGSQTRDFIFIEDLVNAVWLAATKENTGGEVFQIATSHETTVNEIASNLLLILAKAGYDNLEIIHGSERTGDVKRNFSDTSKALKLLNWQNKIELHAGLKKTVNWFVSS